MYQTTIFFIGLGFLVLFVAYFAVEAISPKRWLGTVLAAGVAALSVYFFKTTELQLGIDLKGGSEFICELQPNGDEPISPDAQQQAADILVNRLDPNGTGMLVQPNGDDKILIQAPGATAEERERIIDILQEVVQLELVLTHPQSGPAMISQIREGDALPPPGYRLAEGYKGDTTKAVVVKALADVEGTHVTGAHTFNNPVEGYGISVRLDSDGGDKMFHLTKNNIGRPMAILLNGEAISAPAIRGTFSSNFQITGDFKEAEARRISAALSNPLQNQVKVIRESSITPTMGEQTQKQGLYAGLAGLAITLVFVLIYYNIAGIVATIGLAVNVALIFGTMALLNFTLTMPGIAGIILTIGIAIDANVLIYERLREELRNGKSLKSALDAAYGKAFSAIFDANITTLITAGILFWLATGTVKGFAITLMIGVFGSLFAALLVTRVVFGWLLAGGLLKKIRLWDLITQQSINFLSKGKLAIVISGILLVAAIGTLVVKGSGVLDVNLKGGDLMRIAATDVTEEQLDQVFSNLELDPKPSVQTQTPAGSDKEIFSIRSGFGEADGIFDELESVTGQSFVDREIEAVDSAVGESMLNSSLLALGAGLLMILVYVTIRFEFAFALGAIVALIHDLIICVGLTALFGREVSLVLVGAFLTIAGYSINDTIVVFDRVREGLQTRNGKVIDIMNFSLNATLARTVLTSLTTLIVVLTLFIFGGPALNDFAFTLILGVLVGTYSSIFVASPIVLWWANKRGINLRREVLDTEEAKIVAPAAQG